MRRTTWIAIIAALTLASGCSPSNDGTGAPATAAPANGQAVHTIDLSRELVMNPALVIGKTTYAELSQKYGAPLLTKVVKSAFRRDLSSSNPEPPQIEETLAVFKVNPVTGKPLPQGYPLYFTNDARKVLVAAPVLLLRGDLKEKFGKGSLTLEDVKRVYGPPTRENGKALEYYDFRHKAVLHVLANSEGKIVALLTRYDQLYADDPADLSAHEEIIRRLSQKQG